MNLKGPGLRSSGLEKVRQFSFGVLEIVMDGGFVFWLNMGSLVRHISVRRLYQVSSPFSL